jgi:hypothetical protein
MPAVRITHAVTENAGTRLRTRIAYLTSCERASSHAQPSWSVILIDIPLAGGLTWAVCIRSNTNRSERATPAHAD